MGQDFSGNDFEYLFFHNLGHMCAGKKEELGDARFSFRKASPPPSVDLDQDIFLIALQMYR